ncbi:hypothetical protein [Mesorhizobium sp. WSM4884]|uniref:hypothetical protein n=1 Tax=Mesorhizobium sp. WSM4884 TaxID=3038542 RepID=UPI002416F3DD|nr:hypothetical protein [Mesorhizobium sp. WSM4884]MDG4881122.1 hypothetical protein [Mesorhizobium sp. WSM4884]
MSAPENAMVTEPIESKTIRGSRGKVAVYLLTSLAFVYGGATMRDDAFVGWGSVILFGSTALVFFWWLVRPPLLLLDSDGFTLQGGFVRTPQQVLWGDIDSFLVYRLPRGSDAIGYNFRDDAKGASPLALTSKRLGTKVLLPGRWPLSTEQMVEALNAYRLEALTRQRAQLADRLPSGRRG